MSRCKGFADMEGKKDLAPLEVLQTAFDAMNKNTVGSCTALVGSLNVAKSGTLYLNAINVGDSKFAVFSPEYESRNVLKYQPSLLSLEQQFSFNFPFQLGTYSQDRPSDGELYTVPLHSGDVVVLGTDGLWDNCFNEEIAKLLKDVCKLPALQIANKIATMAFEFSVDKKRQSPFYRGCKANLTGYTEEQMLGGKKDDITVLVLKVRLLQKE